MLRAIRPVTKDKKFRDDPVRTVYRHWLCPIEDCNGEMMCGGHGITTMETNWQHRCDKCGYEEWAVTTYPGIEHIR